MSAADEHALTALLALDALDGDERAAAEAHAAACGACAAELAGMRAAVGAWAGAVPPVPPPAALRARVLAALDDVPQLPAQLPARVPVVVPAAPPGDELALRRSRHAARRRPLVQVLGAAAAAVVVAGAAVLGWTALSLRGDRDAAQAAASAVAAVAAAPDAVTVAATDGQQGWRATRVIASRSLGEAVLVPTGVAAAADGRTWQVWFVRDGAARSAGTFTDPAAGVAVLQGDLDGAGAVAVTDEPSGGSTAPTSTPVALFTVPA